MREKDTVCKIILVHSHTVNDILGKLDKTSLTCSRKREDRYEIVHSEDVTPPEPELTDSEARGATSFKVLLAREYIEACEN